MIAFGVWRGQRRRPSSPTPTVVICCVLALTLVRGCCAAAKCVPRRLSSDGRSWGNNKHTVAVRTDRIGHGYTMDDIVVYQSPTTPLPTGMPAYIVHILNERISRECQLSDIHLRCGWFASTNLINPRVFRRLAYDNCLVNDGKPLPPGGLSFTYTNSFKFPLFVSHAVCK